MPCTLLIASLCLAPGQEPPWWASTPAMGLMLQQGVGAEAEPLFEGAQGTLRLSSSGESRSGVQQREAGDGRSSCSGKGTWFYLLLKEGTMSWFMMWFHSASCSPKSKVVSVPDRVSIPQAFSLATCCVPDIFASLARSVLCSLHKTP